MNFAIQGLGIAGIIVGTPGVVLFLATGYNRVIKLRPSRESWLVRWQRWIIGASIVGDIMYVAHLILENNPWWAAGFGASSAILTIFMILNARDAQESFDRRQADSAGIFHCSNCRENHHLSAPCFHAMARQHGLEIEKIEEGR